MHLQRIPLLLRSGVGKTYWTIELKTVILSLYTYCRWLCWNNAYLWLQYIFTLDFTTLDLYLASVVKLIHNYSCVSGIGVRFSEWTRIRHFPTSIRCSLFFSVNFYSRISNLWRFYFFHLIFHDFLIFFASSFMQEKPKKMRKISRQGDIQPTLTPRWLPGKW